MTATNSTKERLTAAINTVVTLSEYDENDYVFSGKCDISSTDMVYILQQLSKDFNFKITDDFVDAMEACTFAQLEGLLEKYENTNCPKPV